MKKLLGLFAVGSALLLGGVAHAQTAAGAPATTTTVESTTTTEGSDVIVSDDTTVDAMPTTGGAPMAMALTGMLTAAGGFFVRRKLA